LFLCVLCKAQSGHQVTGLPGSSANTDISYAGYITTDPQTDSNLFYWFFPSRSNPTTDPVVLWMTGGPGCSSELAVVFENGPFSIEENFTLLRNPYSWNTNANMLYIDQPYGTGFSYSDGSTVKNETEMADDMYIFLTLWFQEYSQYAQNDFYITGESFGGHYVPALANRILTSSDTFNLRGIGIGNGWVNPEIQYGSYGPFAYMNNLINEKVYTQMNKTYEQCVKAYSISVSEANEICSKLMNDVLASAGNINIYNIDEQCTCQPICYCVTLQTDYFNNKQTQQALGVNQNWQVCQATQITTKDVMSPFAQDIPIVLANHLPVVIYNGMLDLICNYVGGDMWTLAMEWPYSSQYASAPLQPWQLNGVNVGNIKTFANFTFIEVEQAGHMVPHDQPAVALAILEILLSNSKPSQKPQMNKNKKIDFQNFH